jgi:hypothetical protein
MLFEKHVAARSRIHVVFDANGPKTCSSIEIHSMSATVLISAVLLARIDLFVHRIMH